MDFTDALKTGGASATLIAIIGIIMKVVNTFCGHRCRSECCGHQATAGVRVEAFPSPKDDNLGATFTSNVRQKSSMTATPREITDPSPQSGATAVKLELPVEKSVELT